MEIGKSVEDFVENLCTKSFFADFIIRNPKYRKANGHEKEAADILAVFDGTLVVIQVKTRLVDLTGDAVSPTEKQRVRATLEKTTRQFRAFAEAWREPNFTSFVNGRGRTIQVDKKSITDIVFLVVFAPAQKNPTVANPPLRLSPTCYADTPLAIHVFTLDQFSLLLTFADTAADFILYLQARYLLHHHKVVADGADPIDEWAFTTFERPRVLSALRAEKFTDVAGMMLRYQAEVARLDREEKPSYFVDYWMELLNSAIDAPMQLNPKFSLSVEPNSVKAYEAIIGRFARLNRTQRSRLVEFLISRVSNCQQQEFSFRGVRFNEDDDEAYLLMSSRRERADRRIELGNLAIAAGCKMKVKAVVGLAVGSNWPTDPDIDIVVADTSTLKPNYKLPREIDALFAKMRAIDR